MKDIYRGYEIYYGDDVPEPYYAQVWLNGERVYNAMSYDAACDWIDREKRKQR